MTKMTTIPSLTQLADWYNQTRDRFAIEVNKERARRNLATSSFERVTADLLKKMPEEERYLMSKLAFMFTDRSRFIELEQVAYTLLFWNISDRAHELVGKPVSRRKPIDSEDNDNDRDAPL